MASLTEVLEQMDVLQHVCTKLRESQKLKEDNLSLLHKLHTLDDLKRELSVRWRALKEERRAVLERLVELRERASGGIVAELALKSGECRECKGALHTKHARAPHLPCGGGLVAAVGWDCLAVENRLSVLSHAPSRMLRTSEPTILTHVQAPHD